MKLLVLILLFAFFSAPASARECPSVPANRSGEVPREFYLCLLAEIRDLQREQQRFRRTIAEFERALGEMPVDYRNEDGNVTVEPDRRIGKAILVLSARLTGGASSLEVDQAVLEELCSSRGGCEISIFFQAFGVRDTDLTEMVASGPCIFSYTSTTGAWARGEGCDPEGSLNGIDGDNAVAGAGQNSSVIATAGGACLLAESDARRQFVSPSNELQRDHSKGLFLLAIPSRQEQGTRRFRCNLEIR